MQSRTAENISAFTLSAGAVAGEYARVSYAAGWLSFESGGRFTQPMRLVKRLKSSEQAALMEGLANCGIERWPCWDDSRLRPLGRSFPVIELVYEDGEVVRWTDSSIPPHARAAWRTAEDCLSRLLNVEFHLSLEPTPR